jgi:hypothetical protein
MQRTRNSRRFAPQASCCDRASAARLPRSTTPPTTGRDDRNLASCATPGLGRFDRAAPPRFALVPPTGWAVIADDPRIVGSRQPTAADRRPRARGVAAPRRTNLAPPVTPISSCCFSLVCRVVPDDDVGLRDGRQRCASRTTRGCRRRREQSLPAASSWLLAQEPDVDPARVPEATGATIRRHRRRDRNRLDGVGDQPSPRR